MIETCGALQLLLPACTQPAAMPTTRSAAAKAAAGLANKPTEGGEHVAATKGGPKARKGRQGAAASTAAAAAAADAEEASQQAEGAPRAKRQRQAAVTVPELAGPPCFPTGHSLVRVGTSGEEGQEACGEPNCWAWWSQGCFGRIPLSSSWPPDASGWQYKHWRGPDGFYSGEVWATCMRTLAIKVCLLCHTLHSCSATALAMQACRTGWSGSDTPRNLTWWVPLPNRTAPYKGSGEMVWLAGGACAVGSAAASCCEPGRALADPLACCTNAT